MTPQTPRTGWGELVAVGGVKTHPNQMGKVLPERQWKATPDTQEHRNAQYRDDGLLIEDVINEL